MTPVPQIRDFPPSLHRQATTLLLVLLHLLSRCTLLSTQRSWPELDVHLIRHFDSCNWPSAKLPTYGELALRFCGAAGRAVYQRYCNSDGLQCVCARAANSAQFYMQFRGGGRRDPPRMPRFLIISTRSSRDINRKSLRPLQRAAAIDIVYAVCRQGWERTQGTKNGTIRAIVTESLQIVASVSEDNPNDRNILI